MLTDEGDIDIAGSFDRAQSTKYVDVLVIAVYIVVLLRYFQLSTFLSRMFVVFKNVVPNVLSFTFLWWLYVFLFAQILTYTWGQRNIAYKQFDITVIMTLCSMVMSSTTTNNLSVTNFETPELM